MPTDAQSDPHPMAPSLATVLPHSAPYSSLECGHSEALPILSTCQALAGLYISAHVTNSGVNSHEFFFVELH